MWVIFHDPKTAFTHLDKYVLDLVEDKDILEYQKELANSLRTFTNTLVPNVSHLQPFIGNDYYAKFYVPTTQCTSKMNQPVQKKPETLKASLFRVWEPQNPCNTEQ